MIIKRINKIGVSKILLLLASTIFGLLVAEGITRFLPHEFIEHRKILIGDPLLAIPPSNKDVAADFPLKRKPDDVFRIIVLGDSQTVSVPKEATYAEVLQKLLNRNELNGKRVEVHNAGAPGHSHYQYYLALDQRLKQYNPDLVIVGSYVGNDFLDLYRIDDRPSLFFDGHDLIHRDPVFYKFYDPSQIGTGLIEHSSLMQLLHLVFQKTVGYPFNRVRVQWQIGKRPGEGNIAAASYLYPIMRGYFINQHIYRQSINQILFLNRFPMERQAIDRINERVTLLMREMTNSSGVRLLYMPIPTKLQVEPDADSEVLNKIFEVSGLVRSDLQVEDELYDSFTSMLEKYGIEHIRVADALKESATRGILYDHTYHITEYTNDLLGRALYETVRPMVESKTTSMGLY